MDNIKSVIDDIVYLHIETTYYNNKEYTTINLTKVKNLNFFETKALTFFNDKVSLRLFSSMSIEGQRDSFRVDESISLIKSFNDYIEGLPVICNDTELLEQFSDKTIYKNKVLNLKELVAILEPWRKNYELEYLINEITTIDNRDGLNKSICIIIAVNSLLCRHWQREEENNCNNELYNNIKEVLIKEWSWNNYLIKPIMFSYLDYPYVLFKDNINIKTKFPHKKIDYSKCEKLLRDIELWSHSGNLKYQYRKDQELIAAKILENFLKKQKVFIEAPTGSGKTFAYLLIVIIATYINKLKQNKDDTNFIISTDTKELQDQLIDRDIPNILNSLGLLHKVKYGAMKGKGNYLCIERLEKCKEFGDTRNGLLAYIFFKQLGREGRHGDLESINYWAMKHFNVDLFKEHINCESDNCNFERCNKECYLKNRYNELSKENITVINHSLLANWPYTEKRVINHLIIDEAHNLVEKSHEFFSSQFDSLEIIELIKSIDSKNPSILFLLSRLNGLYNYKERIDNELIKNKAKDIEMNIAVILNEFRRMNLHNNEYNFTEEFFNGEEKNKKVLESMIEPISNLKSSIFSLFRVIDTYIKNIVYDDEKDSSNEYKSLINYVSKLRTAFEVIDSFLEFSKDYAKILEIHKDFKYFKLKNTPLNIGTLINENILKEVKSTVFISATLRINNNFKNVKKILEQEEAQTLQVESIFNLKKRTKIILLKDIGSYKNQEKYIMNSAKFIYEVAKKNKGHLLVLFSNNIRRSLIEQKLRELTFGTKVEVHTSKKAIPYLKDMNREVILLGTRGFYEGIDIPGDALNCVIVDKIPNVSPIDPLYKALRSYKGILYKDYNYPKICISMKQAYGRLIRSVTDYGYFIILDGGTNENTIKLLQRDLQGSDIKYMWAKEVLNKMEFDFRKWKDGV